MRSKSSQEDPHPKRVGIWIRVSTEDQAKGESPEHHQKRASTYAEAKGWKVREIYHLEAVSGKSVMSHPETQRMLKHLKTGHITGLIFSKLARLARNTRELLEFSDIFREYDADLISLQESVDTTTPTGRLFYTVIAAMAQWEREEIAERVAASVPIRAKLAKPLGGAAPFGYQWVGKKLAPHPQEAPIRKLLHELFLEHRRKKTVARLLNEAGYRTRNGSKFSDTTVDRLLRDPTAKGIRRANYTKSLGENKKWVLKPRQEWVEIPVEPIISEDLWNQCNAILEERQRGKKPPARKAVHLFAGVALCTCGHKMYVPSNTPKYVCYHCRNKIPVTDLEAVFYEQLRNFFFTPSEIAEYLKQADKVVQEKTELIKALEEEQKKVKDEIEQTFKLYYADQLSVEGFGLKYKPLEKRLKQLEDEIPRLQGEIDFLKIQYLSSDQTLHDAQNFYNRWPDLEPEEKRKVIENIVENITIGKDDVTINLCYLPPSPSKELASRQRCFRGLVTFPYFGTPYPRYTLVMPRPILPPKGYPISPVTIGEHLRKKRLDFGLFQFQVAEKLGVTKATIWGWEHGTKPAPQHHPKIIQFLDYRPEPQNNIGPDE